MGNAALRLSEKSRDVNWTVAGILGLLIITALAIVPLTLTILQNRESDALVIDLAGQQRMLLERHMKELLLASQGLNTQHERTRAVLQERLKVLVNGGSINAQIGRSEYVSIPAAPTDEIRLKLLDQQRLLDAFQIKAEQFLRGLPNAPSYETVRDELLRGNAMLLQTANDAVTLLRQYSDEGGRALVRWEIAVILLVVLVASLLTWLFLQAGKELQKSQAATVEALRQSDAVKSALLSSVSHDLRTPLTSIKSMVFGLQDDSGSQPSHVRMEFLQSIDQELDYLNRLVGNLLDMSRIEAGILVPHREWNIFDELLEGAIRRVASFLEGRPLQVEMVRDLPPIFVDGVQIQQVLVNLLDNAIKFSPSESPVRITASLVAETLEVRVSNTGEGVPPDELDRIFDRFYRVQSGRSSGSPGTGLGLAICKGIVEAHGGHIMAESVPGEETTILFQVPLMTSMPTRERLASEPYSVQRVS